MPITRSRFACLVAGHTLHEGPISRDDSLPGSIQQSVIRYLSPVQYHTIQQTWASCQSPGQLCSPGHTLLLSPQRASDQTCVFINSAQQMSVSELQLQQLLHRHSVHSMHSMAAPSSYVLTQLTVCPTGTALQCQRTAAVSRPKRSSCGGQ